MTVGNWVNFAWTGKVVQVMKATAPKPYNFVQLLVPMMGRENRLLPPHRVLLHEYKIIKNSHKK